MIDLYRLNQHRQGQLEIALYGTLGDSTSGIFTFRSPVSRRDWLRCIASSGDGWQHVSVSLEKRCPYWDEMEWVKRQFFEPHEVCMQLHVAESEHISMHPFCLHLWKPTFCDIPLPPPEFVGTKSEKTA